MPSSERMLCIYWEDLAVRGLSEKWVVEVGRYPPAPPCRGIDIGPRKTIVPLCELMHFYGMVCRNFCRRHQNRQLGTNRGIIPSPKTGRKSCPTDNNLLPSPHLGHACAPSSPHRRSYNGRGRAQQQYAQQEPSLINSSPCHTPADTHYIHAGLSFLRCKVLDVPTSKTRGVYPSCEKAVPKKHIAVT